MKRKILAIIPVLMLLGSTLGYAASMDVGGVEGLGSGTQLVLPPDLEVTSVEWTLSTSDYTKVGQVNITVEAIGYGGSAFGPYDFYFVLKDNGGGVLAQTSVLNQYVNSIDGVHEFEWDLGPSPVDAASVEWFWITVTDH